MYFQLQIPITMYLKCCAFMFFKVNSHKIVGEASKDVVTHPS